MRTALKFDLGNCRATAGSVMLTTLILACILGLTLVGYLYWVRTENLLVAQSQAWNGAFALAEAGIEEGMAQINATFGTNYMPSISTNFPNPAPGVYGPRTNTFGNDSYSVVVITTNTFPTIIATGYSSVPIVGRPVKRVVQVTTTNEYTFSVAMAAQQNITFSGNGVLVDSFDSSDPLHSTNGLYDAATRKAGGDIASIAGIISVGNANVNGKLYTGPTATDTLGSLGFVGDLNWTGPGIEPGWWGNDYNLDMRPVQLPDTSSFVLATADANNNYALPTGGFYISGDLIMQGTNTMLVSGYTTLYVSGNVSMSGHATINIAPGAQLKLYVGGANASFNQVNTTGNCSTFQYYGLPSNLSLNWSGNNAYVGSVYAPQAQFTCGGGGSTDNDYQGSCIVRALKLNGHFGFHYDENLKRNGPISRFTINTWQEL
jgi:hypothetical protein